MKNTDYFSWKTRRKQTFAPQAVVKFIQSSADCVMLLAVSSTYAELAPRAGCLW
jgi:hypothetical protein